MRPLCLGASGSVRATSMHHFEYWAKVVQTFCPVTTHSSPSLTALVFSEREVGARLRLGEALAPDLLGGEDRLQVALLLLLGAVRDHDRAAHREAEHVGRRRRLGAGISCDEDRLLDQRRAAAAVLLGPGDPGPAGLVELALPVAAEGDDLVEALGLRAGVVLVQPGANLVAEDSSSGGQGEVHEGEPHRGWPAGQERRRAPAGALRIRIGCGVLGVRPSAGDQPAHSVSP